MTCPDPQHPHQPTRETLNRLIDLVAWAKTCLLITAATPPGSPERIYELQELREAVVEPRHLTDKILGSSQKLPQALLVDLRTCELAIPKLEAGAVLRASSAHSSADPKSPPKSAA
jgi:hypothetical protein